jgi:hypothetical protein
VPPTTVNSAGRTSSPHAAQTVRGLNDGFGSTMPTCFSLPPDEARQEMMRFFADPDQFEQIGLIPLGYNRAILLMAQAFHGTGETFGDSPETGRLSPHFEFYAA